MVLRGLLSKLKSRTLLADARGGKKRLDDFFQTSVVPRLPAGGTVSQMQWLTKHMRGAFNRGSGMQPTLQPWDLCVLDVDAVKRGAVKAGDVVFARPSATTRKQLCQRVLGLEGDRVFIPETPGHPAAAVKVPTGHVWLQSDNASERGLGSVPYTLLTGRVAYKVLPLWEAGPVDSGLPEWLKKAKAVQLSKKRRR